MSGLNWLSLRVLGAALALCLLAPVGSVFAQDADATINMQGLSFAPTTVHIGPGATVLWTNSSPLAHTVTADDGSFDSDMLDTPGTYQYFCKPHGSAGLHGMAATIVVDDPEAIQEITAPGPATVAPKPRDPNPTDYQPDH